MNKIKCRFIRAWTCGNVAIGYLGGDPVCKGCLKRNIDRFLPNSFRPFEGENLKYE